METDATIDKNQAAALLRQLAAALESDDATGVQVEGVEVTLPPQVEVSVEVEQEEGETELEIEFKWSDAAGDRARTGKYELFQGAGGRWYFRLKAPNGEIILASEGYASKQGAADGIESVRRNAGSGSVENRTSSAGQPYFVVKAENHEVIGTSQMYKRRAGRDRGAQSVARHAPDATVVTADT
jgi:amphi-Trp domain-containing protein